MVDFKSFLVSKTSDLVLYLQKQQENQKTLASFEIAFTFAVSSLFLIFAIKPAATTISGLVGDINAKTEQSTVMRQKINQIVAAQEAFSQIQSQYDLIESALPSSPNYSQAAIQLLATGQSVGLPLDSVNFSLNSGTTNPMFFASSISHPATFAQILSLLTGLKDNRRLISLKQLTISLPQKNNSTQTNFSTDQVSFSVGTNIYYWNSHD